MMRNRMKAAAKLAALFVLVLTMTACGSDSEHSTTTQSGESKAAFGAFTAQDLDGKEATQEIFKDAQVTMINIWGTFCGPCIGEMPDLGALAEEYRDKNLQIIGIVADAEVGKNEDNARKIVQQTGANYRHLFSSAELKSGYLGGVWGLPTTVFVNQDGEILNVYTGAKSKEKWINIIDQELAK